jgi:hypothetical protein
MRPSIETLKRKGSTPQEIANAAENLEYYFCPDPTDSKCAGCEFDKEQLLADIEYVIRKGIDDDA